MRIDVHCHYNPPSYFQMLREVGAFGELRSLRTMGHLWRPDKPMAVMGSGPDAAARRVADMDAASVDRQIMSIVVLPYLQEKRAATNLARHVNDALREFIDHAPTRLTAFGCLPMPHVDEAVAEVARCFDELGFAGIAMGGSANGQPHDYPAYAPVWEALDSRSAIVYIHPGTEPVGLTGSGEFHLSADYVSPAEVAVCASRMIASGHLDRYPNLTYILATLGGAIPFLARRFDRGLLQDCPERWEELGGVLQHFRRFYCDTSVIEEPDALRAGRDTFGVDKILFGSDYGRPGVSSMAAVEYVRHANGLSDAERTSVLDENAARLFAR